MSFNPFKKKVAEAEAEVKYHDWQKEMYEKAAHSSVADPSK